MKKQAAFGTILGHCKIHTLFGESIINIHFFGL